MAYEVVNISLIGNNMQVAFKIVDFRNVHNSHIILKDRLEKMLYETARSVLKAMNIGKVLLAFTSWTTRRR